MSSSRKHVARSVVFAAVSVFVLLQVAVADGVAFSRVVADVSALPPEMHLVGDLLMSRVTERTPESSAAGTLRVRYLIDVSVPDDYACVNVSVREGCAEIRAPRMRGLVAGTGNLLKSLQYGKDTFVATEGTFDFRPAKSFREAYLARHFMNYFMEAPADELCRQVDDLVLDGINSFWFQFAMPTVDKARASADETARFENASRKMNARVAALDCDFTAEGGTNQMPTDSPEEFRAEPNTDPKRPSTGFNVCPAKPKALQALLDQQRGVLNLYKDAKKVSIFSHWPYDEGGCGCKICSPWGGKGYLKLIEKLHGINIAAFPNAKTRISTWFFDDADFDGLWKFLETHDWVDYVLVDDFGDKYPEYPLKHSIPGRAKIVTFPEISMWGRVPWGGYGTIATPRLMESMFRQAESVADGFSYYSEGRFEDINKAIVLGLYLNPKTTTDDILRQYAAYHFAGADPEDFVRLGNLLETNHRPHLMRRTNVEEALSIARKMDGEMLPQLARDWRWRQVYLRTLIDREIVVRGSFEPESAHPYFDELVKIYHAQHQLRWVLDGKMGGWTCPKYMPRGAAKVYSPLSGDATKWLQDKIDDRNLVTMRLGHGDWRLGNVAIRRSRFELILEDGCRLVATSSGPAALCVGKCVDGVTVRGEGNALIEIPVVVEQATNVVIRNIVMPDGDVRLIRSESVSLDLAPSVCDEPAGNATEELARIDKMLEWAHQHAEYEKVERLYEKEKTLKAVLGN